MQITQKLQALSVSLVAAFAMTLLLASPASAVSCDSTALLTFPTWYDGLQVESGNNTCEIKVGEPKNLWIIALNAVEILLQAVAYGAVAYLVWGGFKYMKSRGDSGKIQNSKDAIINAIVGLIISLSSVAIVNFIAGNIGGDREAAGLPRVNAGQLQLDNIMNNIIFPVAGAVAVIFVIMGAIQYIMSDGDSSKIDSAKNTIIYSLVGLVFVIMAFAIVQLILGRFQ